MRIPQLTPTQVAAARSAGDAVVLLDVREPEEVALASLDDVVHIPMGEVPRRAPAELDADDRIVVVCHHGVRSFQVAAWLQTNGFADVSNLTGGIDAWSRQVDPAVPRY